MVRQYSIFVYFWGVKAGCKSFMALDARALLFLSQCLKLRMLFKLRQSKLTFIGVFLEIGEQILREVHEAELGQFFAHIAYFLQIIVVRELA